MRNGILKIKNLIRFLIFFPVIFYIGPRSYIGLDEGFYALQARWILEKGNWTIPMWFDEYVLDRTIGVQFLIAKSQEIFGKNLFAAYLPTTISAIIMLFVTYKLHEEFFDKKYAIISPLILSTTYLWFDYSHLATQDIIYSSLVTIGVFALVKIKNNKSNFYIFLFGAWIGLAFIMKTFLVAVPLAAFFPYLKTKYKLFFTKFFWIGLLIGFFPYLLWTYHINSYLDQNIILYLLGKFNTLANKNNFTNPFYYYFWNIPITYLPWSIFAIVGLIINTFYSKKDRLILSYFPLIVILILSIFSTKTPYYPLQISAILSLNSFVGIKYLFSSNKFRSFVINTTSKIIPTLIFLLVFIYLLFLQKDLNLDLKENIMVVSGLILFAISWSFIKSKKNIQEIFTVLILGPYLLTSLLLQSGLFTDRSKDLRVTMEYLSSLDILKNQTIKVDKNSINAKTQSKIIKISLQTPNLGDAIKSINELQASEIAWTTNSLKGIDNSYQVLLDNKNLSPWKLIKKNQ